MSTRTAPRSAAPRRAPVVPPQHGAWAFLALPVVLAGTIEPATWWTALLTLAWFASYPASYAGARLMRDRRPERYRGPFAMWLVLSVVPATLLVFRFPWLLWAGVVLLGLVAVNLHYVRRNDERALLNDLVIVTECALLVPVTWAVNSGMVALPAPSSLPVHVGVLTAVCWLVLTGSTLHVKSLIRERRDPRYARASRAFAAVSLVASAALAVAWGLPSGWWLVLPFVALVARAFLVGRRPTRAVTIGLVELAMLVAVAGAAALA